MKIKINQLETIEDLEEVFKWLNESLYRFVYMRCGFNREQAEDITQDVFIKAWEKRSTFKPNKGTLKNWIYIIARNYIIDFYRKKKGILSGYSDDVGESVKEQGLTVDDELMLGSIISNLDKLKEQEKEVIVLRYLQDFEIEDVAEIINKKHNATKVMIHRAVKKLKDIMKLPNG
ncbi:RNA polymerase sigma factor [Candidatus Dojkabacteria bacterium]|nr:RNA polymerase sigma factor [Candidatus Dojkabacteria bacterium]